MRAVAAAFAAVLLVLAVPAAAAELAGKYEVEGRNPDGGSYSGTAVIAPNGEAWVVQWQVGQERYQGTAIRRGDTLAVGGREWVVLYEIRDDGSLRGVWTTQGGDTLGLEILTPAGTDM